MAKIDLLSQRVANETARREYESKDVTVVAMPSRILVRCEPFRSLCLKEGIASAPNKCLIEVSSKGFHLIKEIDADLLQWDATFDIGGVDSSSYVVWVRVVNATYEVLAGCRIIAAVDLSSFLDIEVVDLGLETWKVRIDGDRIKLRLNRTSNFGAVVKAELESGGHVHTPMNSTQIVMMRSIIASISLQMCGLPESNSLRVDWEDFTQDSWGVTKQSPSANDEGCVEVSEVSDYIDAVVRAFESHHQPLKSWASLKLQTHP